MKFPQCSDTLIFLIDVQERLLPVMAEKEELIKNFNILLSAAAIFDMRVIVTEQYPAGLGHTVEILKSSIPKGNQSFEKITFSCLRDKEILLYLQRYIDSGFRNIVFTGIEAHICVLQTALDSKRLFSQCETFILEDCVTSRNILNKRNALHFAERMGIKILNTESLLFMLLEDSKHPNFKDITRLLK